MLTTGEISGIIIAAAVIVLGVIVMFILITVKRTKTFYFQRYHTSFGVDHTTSQKYEVLLSQHHLAITYYAL